MEIFQVFVTMCSTSSAADFLYVGKGLKDRLIDEYNEVPIIAKSDW